jgi:hypothetical protein
VLVQFGGFEGFDPLRDWPEQERVHWLVPTLDGRARNDALPLDRLGLGVLDVLGSCDAIVTKPGYGTVTEAACNCKPVLYVSRHDWPEEKALTDWLKEQVPTREIPLADLVAGRIVEAILELVSSRPVEPVPPTGTEEAADLLEPLLTKASREHPR